MHRVRAQTLTASFPLSCPFLSLTPHAPVSFSYMEISAIRHIANKDGCKFDIIVATTEFLNGHSMLRSLMGHSSSGAS